ncbi:MAG: hypothetical protein ACXABY_33000 [Candidatus Thorarchaeota archaeon]|jgi:hypothetical protein
MSDIFSFVKNALNKSDSKEKQGTDTAGGNPLQMLMQGLQAQQGSPQAGIDQSGLAPGGVQAQPQLNTAQVGQGGVMGLTTPQSATAQQGTDALVRQAQQFSQAGQAAPQAQIAPLPTSTPTIPLQTGQMVETTTPQANGLPASLPAAGATVQDAMIADERAGVLPQVPITPIGQFEPQANGLPAVQPAGATAFDALQADIAAGAVQPTPFVPIPESQAPEDQVSPVASAGVSEGAKGIGDLLFRLGAGGGTGGENTILGGIGSLFGGRSSAERARNDLTGVQGTSPELGRQLIPTANTTEQGRQFDVTQAANDAETQRKIAVAQALGFDPAFADIVGDSRMGATNAQILQPQIKKAQQMKAFQDTAAALANTPEGETVAQPSTDASAQVEPSVGAALERGGLLGNEQSAGAIRTLLADLALSADQVGGDIGEALTRLFKGSQAGDANNASRKAKQDLAAQSLTESNIPFARR